MFCSVLLCHPPLPSTEILFFFQRPENILGTEAAALAGSCEEMNPLSDPVTPAVIAFQ